ncbi:MAG TPA: thioredoxin [Propionibacteriaceae bacterium]|nr:thioredoxin [Propionibacteriaceae bacterium]HPZ50377.1 thioredoxin [Propionibacteriaceae bacterium]HQE31078.1 thioredoxin [Propionibacteriaceae bacterium]
MATVELTAENFAETVSTTDALIIDFWAPWCNPCLRFAPVFEAVSEDHPDVVFAKVNTEEHQDIAQALQINSIPTLMALRAGILVFRQAGALTKPALTDIVTQLEGLDVEELKRDVAAQGDDAHDHDHSDPTHTHAH